MSDKCPYEVDLPCILPKDHDGVHRDAEGFEWGTFDPKERTREKQESRDQDEEDLRSGRKTREQLRKERNIFGSDKLKLIRDPKTFL